MDSAGLGPRLLALLSGATLFFAVQAWLFYAVAEISGISNSGWFLNTSRGVATVCITFAAAGALMGLLRSDAHQREATLAAAGGVVAMVIVLFHIGPGTLFPIVLAIGTVMIGGSTAAGLVLGILLRRLALTAIRR